MDGTGDVHLHVSGKTLADCIAKVAQQAGGVPLTSIETDALIAELRERMAKQGMVVKVLPFDEPVAGAAPANDTGTGKRGARKPREEKPAEQTKPADKAIETKTEPVADAPKTAPADVGGDWDDGDNEEAGSEITLDDVKSALNEFAATYGQPKAREVISAHAKDKSVRLMDVDPSKYAALVQALRVKQAA